MSADSAPQFVVPPSLSTYARPETLSGPANPPTKRSALEALSSDESNHTLVDEDQSPSNDSTVCQDTNAEPIVHKVSFPRIPPYKALGLLSIITLAGGNIIVLAALPFLVFLWYGEGSCISGEYATSAWRKIMLGDSLPQVITLTSLAMRVTIAAQATSMCAALILERRRVRKSQAAQFSIARSVNDGPWKLILTLLQDVPTQISLCPESILIVLLGFEALGTQFTSTILFWDLGDTSLAQFPSTTFLNLTAVADTLMKINTLYWN